MIPLTAAKISANAKVIIAATLQEVSILSESEINPEYRGSKISPYFEKLHNKMK